MGDLSIDVEKQRQPNDKKRWPGGGRSDDAEYAAEPLLPCDPAEAGIHHSPCVRLTADDNKVANRAAVTSVIVTAPELVLVKTATRSRPA